MFIKRTIVRAWVVVLGMPLLTVACQGDSSAKTSGSALADAGGVVVTPPSSPKAPATTNIQSGDCAVILNDVKASHDINVTQNCDVPSEKKIIKMIFDSPFSTECPFAWPRGWTKLDRSPEPTVAVTPRSGDYFSKYQFEYDAEPFGLSVIQRIFVSADRLNFEGDVKGKVQIDLATFNNLVASREKYPGSILDAQILQEANSLPGDPKAPSEKAVGEFVVRSQIHDEDGVVTESSSIHIFSSDGQIDASVYVFPVPPEEPMDATKQYVFSCSANEKMNVETFGVLCAGLIERTTMSEKFGVTECEASSSAADDSTARDAASGDAEAQ